MKQIIFISGLRGANKIKILKALSQIDFTEQPVLLWEDTTIDPSPEMAHATAVYRTVLRVREVYLENRPVVVAGIFPLEDVAAACSRFGIHDYLIIDGALPLDDVVRQISVKLWSPKRLFYGFSQ